MKWEAMTYKDLIIAMKDVESRDLGNQFQLSFFARWLD